MGDPRQSVTDEEIMSLLKSGLRPVWTNSSLAEELNITRQTANRRLKQLEKDSEEVISIQVGRTSAYYVPGVENLQPGDTIEERHKNNLIHEFTDRFVGLATKPWTAVNPNDGPATGGDKIQIQVDGTPARWNTVLTRTWEDRRDELLPEELAEDETQALVSGELYERATTPIEHENYPPDYDIELNIGIKELFTENGTALAAVGPKNYLIRPCNDAVFLKDVSVDFISPKGEGKEIPHTEITRELLEEVEEWRQEQIEDEEDES